MSDDQEEQVFSINDILRSFDTHDIASKVFYIENPVDHELIYFQIKMKKF